MSLFDALALFVIMATLAALPSASVLLVVSQTVRHGTRHGYWAVAGIVMGDLLLLAIAILGMSEVSIRFEAAFSLLRTIGAFYLLWIGWQLVRGAREPLRLPPASSPDHRGLIHPSGPAAFLGALALTFGDIKALMFYASLLPTLVNLRTLSGNDVLTLLSVTILAVGATKCVYVHLGQTVSHSGHLSRLRRYISPVAGVALMATSGYLLITVLTDNF